MWQSSSGWAHSPGKLSRQVFYIGDKRMADKKVVIYSTPTCPYCKRAKDYLSRKGIPYTDINVAQDREKPRRRYRSQDKIAFCSISNNYLMLIRSALALSYPEHLGAACGTNTLCRRLPILHSYGPGILHFPLGTAFHTICLHLFTSFLVWTINH